MIKPALLDIQNLCIDFSTDEGMVHAVNDVSLHIQSGESIAIVGESGAGKSQVFQSVMGLLTKNAQVSGSIHFKNKPTINQSNHTLNQLRGKNISMVFQDPMTSLNPYLTIGKQLTEVLQAHQKISRNQARSSSIEMLQAVKLHNAEYCFSQYPHELSGGMRQRVVIAMALLCQPDLLIADEPTTALDVTVQASIMELLKRFHHRNNMAIALITHDLPLALNFCTRVIVMYAGRIVESGQAEDILYRPKHPYTKALLAASPQNDLDKQGRLHSIKGSLPDPLKTITTCAFQPRCAYADSQCQQQPELITDAKQYQLACFHPQRQDAKTC